MSDMGSRVVILYRMVNEVLGIDLKGLRIIAMWVIVGRV